MFPAHTVLRPFPVVTGFPLRITAVDAWGDYLVVGTAEGALVTLAPVPPSSRDRPNPGHPSPDEYQVRARTRTDM
jgi:hypothetical protein